MLGEQPLSASQPRKPSTATLSKLAQVANAPHSEFLHQAGAETEAMPFPRIFAYVPWRHHVEIITHCKSVEEAAFYIERSRGLHS